MSLTPTEQRLLARHATLTSVEMIAARDGDPEELLSEIRLALEMGVRMDEEAEDVEHAETASA